MLPGSHLFVPRSVGSNSRKELFCKKKRYSIGEIINKIPCFRRAVITIFPLDNTLFKVSKKDRKNVHMRYFSVLERYLVAGFD